MTEAENRARPNSRAPLVCIAYTSKSMDNDNHITDRVVVVGSLFLVGFQCVI